MAYFEARNSAYLLDVAADVDNDRHVPRSQQSPASPRFIQPMAARVIEKLPEGDEWMYEVKFDGYRALLLKDGHNVRIRSRNDKDLTNAYPYLAAAGQRLKATQAVLDGEIVAVDATGRPSFQALQHRGAHPHHTIVFYAFDLLHLDGIDLTTRTLEERRARLPEVVDKSGHLALDGIVRDSTAGHRSRHRPRSRGRHCETKNIAVHTWRAQRGVAEAEARSTAGVRRRWVPTRFPWCRCAARRVLRWKGSTVRWKGARHRQATSEPLIDGNGAASGVGASQLAGRAREESRVPSGRIRPRPFDTTRDPTQADTGAGAASSAPTPPHRAHNARRGPRLAG